MIWVISLIFDHDIVVFINHFKASAAQLCAVREGGEKNIRLSACFAAWHVKRQGCTTQIQLVKKDPGL